MDNEMTENYIEKMIALAVFYIFEGRGIEAGSFGTLLIKTINAADARNKLKLAREYPEYVRAVSMYKSTEASYRELETIAFGS